MTDNYRLINHEGKIAVSSAYVNWTQPIIQTMIWKFPEPAENYGDLYNYAYGKHVGNNIVTFYNKVSWSYVSFLCDTSCQIAMEETPIKPPGRGGKDWKWVWKEGQWRKEARL